LREKKGILPQAMKIGLAAVTLPVLFIVGMQTPSTVQTYFEALPQRFAASQPTPEETQAILKPAETQPVLDLLSTMPGPELAKALPAVVAVLDHPGEPVQAAGALALFMVSRRQDSASLLVPYEAAIVRLLDSPSERLRGLAALTLLNLKAAPSEEVLAAMLVSLNRTDRKPNARLQALAVLAVMFSNRPDVSAAINQFMSGPLDGDTLAAALNAIYSSLVDGEELRRTTIAALDHPQANVKLAALNVLERMGPSAVAGAEQKIKQLSTSDSAEIRSAANRALQRIPR
jgi:hypothetical protein